MLIRAADVSKYGGAVSSEKWAKASADHGVGLAIVGSWHGRDANPHAAQTLCAAADAGLAVATYAVLNSRDGCATVGLAKSACGEQWPNLSFVALDIELDGVTRQVVAGAASEVVAAGLRPIVYTGRWFWASSRHLGNPTWASHLPLWDSHYDGVEALVLHPVYGGWSSADVVGKQYRGSNNGLGFSCDLSVFDPGFVHAIE